MWLKCLARAGLSEHAVGITEDVFSRVNLVSFIRKTKGLQSRYSGNRQRVTLALLCYRFAGDLLYVLYPVWTS